jgi:hypothetical protein
MQHCRARPTDSSVRGKEAEENETTKRIPWIGKRGRNELEIETDDEPDLPGPSPGRNPNEEGPP